MYKELPGAKGNPFRSHMTSLSGVSVLSVTTTPDKAYPLVVPLDQLRQRHRQDPASAHGCFSRPSRHSRHCDHADCPGGRGFVPLRSGICVDSGIVVQAVSLARRATHDTLPGGRLSTRT